MLIRFRFAVSSPWSVAKASGHTRLQIQLWMFAVLTALTATAQREEISLLADWRFALGDHPGAEQSSYPVEDWQRLDVPHDWAFEQPYRPDADQEDKGGYRPGGIGWYRRQIDFPDSWHGRHVRIEFDGIYMNSEVWLNGVLLGRRPYGYVSFDYNLTPHLRSGSNVLAVRVDNAREPSARWYHGCGIYAPVRLVVSDPLHVPRDGVHVTTPQISADSATVVVRTEIEYAGNETGGGEGTLVTRVLDPDGDPVAEAESTIAMHEAKTRTFEQTLRVYDPRRWDLDTPHLYTVVSEIKRPVERVSEEVRTRFGFREIRWETDTGFWLNGRNVKLFGVCEHLEGGPVGAAWPDELIGWKLKQLKAMGCNAVRTAHNPQVPRFYDWCDELGLLVMDEVFDGWGEKAPQDYGAQAFDTWWERDLRATLKRDRNHPSIVIWSVGNETKGVEAVAPDLVRVCHEMDGTRPVTSGHSASDVMDVFGVNGHSERQSFFEPGAERLNKPFIATEAPHTWQVRGFYRTQTWYRNGADHPVQRPFPIPDLTPNEIFTYDWMDPKQRTNSKQVFNSSYDNATVRITARQNWTLMRDLPWFSGHFRWTGFDYPGEAGYVHGGWPFRAFMGGALDLAGFPKDLYHFYRSQWTTEPMVHLLPHWTHPRMEEGTEIPVWAYTNADEVELLLNGESLGRRRPDSAWNELQCEWLVPWRPGTLEAVAYRDGREVARTQHSTAATPARLAVTSDDRALAADGEDVAIITVSQLDAAGVFYPYGENRVGFHLEGPARLLSLENGNPVDTEPNRGVTTRRTFFGLLRAFVQSTREDGDVSLVVGAINGERRQLTSNRVSIDTQRVMLRGEPRATSWEIHYTMDGSAPDRDSPRYIESFTVPLGTAVRAAVYATGDDAPVLELEERFDADAGLYWPTTEASR